MMIELSSSEFRYNSLVEGRYSTVDDIISHLTYFAKKNNLVGSNKKKRKKYQDEFYASAIF